MERTGCILLHLNTLDCQLTWLIKSIEKAKSAVLHDWVVFLCNLIALWDGVHVRYKENNPPWKGKDKGIFVLFVHCFHYFLNVYCNGEMIFVDQKSKKVFT